MIGGQRCASTWLYDLVVDSFGLVGSPLDSFCRVEPKLLLSKIDRRAYLSRFEGSIVLDKSTSYFDHPHAAKNAYDILPDAKIIAILRNPVSRAISHWMFSKRNGLESHTLLEVITNHSLQYRAFTDTSVSPYAYLERGCYARHLKRWSRYFKPENMMIFILEELNNRDALIDSLRNFLNLSSSVYPTTLQKHSLGLNLLNVREYSEISTDELCYARTRLKAYYEKPNLELETFLSRRIQVWS